jgi:hypothetical protein
MERSEAEIINGVHAGAPAAIRIAFISADKGERRSEVLSAVSGLALKGLRGKVLFNAADGAGQAVPTERDSHFVTWDKSDDVPIGEFHLALKRQG